MLSLVRCGISEDALASPRDRRLAAVVALLALASCRGDALVPGRAIHAEVSGTQPFTLRLEVARHEAVRLLVEQHGTDLIVTIAPPSGAPERTIDMRERGVESATLIGDTPGAFTITIERKPAPPAPGQPAPAAASASVSAPAKPAPTPLPAAAFEMRLEGAAHPASDRDRHLQAAEDGETRGKALATGPRAERDKALEPLKEALRLWTDLNDATGRATTLARTGDVHYGAGRFADSERFYTQALVLLRPLNQPYQVAVIENNLGVGQERRGLFGEARTHFKTALDLWQSQLPGAEGDMAVTLVNEGAMLVQYGDYHAAIERFLRALPVLERRNSPLTAAALNNLGAVNQAVGDLEAAQRYFTQAMNALPPGDPLRAHLHLRLAQVALDRGETPAAAANVNDALAILRGTSPIPGIQPDARNLLGQVEASSGRLEAALAAHTQALDLYRGADMRRGMANALHQIGTINRRLGRLPAARDALTRALVLRQEVGLLDAEAETRYELGLLEEQAGSPARAQAYLGAAIAIIEDVRGRVAADYSRTAYFATRQKYFAALIDSLMRGGAARLAPGAAARAFEVAERERARALIDLLRESGTDIRRGVDPALLAQERDEQRQMDFWANQRAKLVNQRGAQAAAEKAFEQMQAHLTAYREIEGRIRAAVARAPSVTSPPVFTLAETQRHLLDPQTRLLRFALGEQRSYAWLVGPKDVTVAVLPSRAEIDALARRAAETLRTPRTLDNARDRELRDRFERDAAALSAMLLGPFAKALGGHRLLIVSEGALQLVPFAALPEPSSRTPLIARHEVAMLPSASAIIVLRQQTAGRARAPKTLAVLADAVYEADDPRLKRFQTPARAAAAKAADEDDGYEVGRLMLSKKEGEAILRFVPPDARFVAYDFDANRETAIGQLGSYRIVHLAAHAFPDSVRPELSALILSKYDAQGRRRSGVLRLHEISAGLDLRAEVVVLSACSTAIGLDVPGEGLMGLARGFFGAGAASVIGSLNTVEEEPTLELMKFLYDEMLGPRQGRPAAALRAAQLKMIDDPRFGDPFYWSPFVFMGDPR